MVVSDKKPSVSKFKRIFVGYLTLIILFTVLASCNFFEGLNPPLPVAEDRAAKAFGDGDYDEALRQYSNALVTDPHNSKARVGYARAAFWKFLPNFTILILESFPDGFDDVGDEVYGKIFNILGSAEGRAAIIPVGNSTFYKVVQNILDSPYGVINGEGDGSVGVDNLELNLMLTIAYTFDLALSLLDTDGDALYGETNGDDLIYVDSAGGIGYSFDLESIEAGFGDMASIDENDNTAEVWTNIKNVHAILEETISLAQFLYSRLGLVDKTMLTLIRPSNYLKLVSSEFYGSDFVGGYGNLYDSLQDASTNSNSLSEFASIFQLSASFKTIGEEGAQFLNDLHNVLVGDYAYPTNQSVFTFTESPWEEHTNGGLKKVIEGIMGFSDLTNITNVTDITNLTPEQISNIVEMVTNSYSPEELSNLAGLMGIDLDNPGF
jgi:hypothetical protein